MPGPVCNHCGKADAENLRSDSTRSEDSGEVYHFTIYRCRGCNRTFED